MGRAASRRVVSSCSSPLARARPRRSCLLAPLPPSLARLRCSGVPCQGIYLPLTSFWHVFNILIKRRVSLPSPLSRHTIRERLVRRTRTMLVSLRAAATVGRFVRFVRLRFFLLSWSQSRERSKLQLAVNAPIASFAAENTERAINV